MQLVQYLVDVFLWPGDYVRRKLHISQEQDGGMLRSMINMLVWGVVVLGTILYLLKV